MQIKKITFFIAILLFCWGQVLAKYELIVTQPTTTNPCNGLITATAIGNTGPFTFEWFNEDGTPASKNIVSTDTSSTLYNYCSGIYEVIVTNDFGCETVLFEKTDIELNVFLEGAYNPNERMMKTTLSTKRKILPGQIPANSLVSATPKGQPYTTKPWEYTGKEGIDWTKYQVNKQYTDVVDWVLVSLRSDVGKDTEIDRRAGLLKKDGSISFPKKFYKLSGVDSVYAVIEHRNHLGIITDGKVNISNNALFYDFTNKNSFTADSTRTGQKEAGNGKWFMLTGDGEQEDSKSDVNGEDKTIWIPQNGKFDVYLSGDYNLNGDTNGEDKLLWEKAFGSFGILGGE